MYEAFYHLKERPFALTPDPAFLFLSAKHSLALSMLEYSLTGQAGFTVVTGEIGSGKTTLIREFMNRTDQLTNLGVISNTHPDFGDVLQWVLMAFSVKAEGADKPSRYQAFVRYLIDQYGAGKKTVLVIDEAQNLSMEMLEEIRLLSNVNADKDQLLQLILVGQPELLEKLRRPELKQFAQRISVHYHLTPLTYLETRDYIHHRLRVAGGRVELFEKMAIAAAYYFAGGIPRVTNSICDMALVYGFAENKQSIDIDTILAVVRDKEKGALLELAKTSDGVTRDDLIEQSRQAWALEDLAEKQKPLAETVVTDSSPNAQEPRVILEPKGPKPATTRQTEPNPRSKPPKIEKSKQETSSSNHAAASGLWRLVWRAKREQPPE